MEIELKKKKKNYNFHVTKHLPLGLPIIKSSTNHPNIYFYARPSFPEATLLHANNNNIHQLRTVNHWIGSLYFLLRFPTSCRPFLSILSLSLSLSSPHREHEAVHRSHGDNKGTILSPLPYTLALSPLFIYRSFVERETARPSSTRIPPSERERVTILDLARIHRRELSWPLEGDLSLSLSFPTFRCRFHRPRAPTIHALHNAYSLSKGPNNRPNKR